MVNNELECRLELSVDSLAESCHLARRLAATLGDRLNQQTEGAEPTKPIIIFLDGPLGAGKSEWCRQIIQHLGYEGPVTSPTYTLIETYSVNKISIQHLDAYRLQAAEELAVLGLGADMAGGYDAEDMQLILVEWGQARECAKVLAADLCIMLDPPTSNAKEVTGGAIGDDMRFDAGGMPEKRNILITAPTTSGQLIIESLKYAIN